VVICNKRGWRGGKRRTFNLTNLRFSWEGGWCEEKSDSNIFIHIKKREEKKSVISKNPTMSGTGLRGE